MVFAHDYKLEKVSHVCQPLSSFLHYFEMAAAYGHLSELHTFSITLLFIHPAFKTPDSILDPFSIHLSVMSGSEEHTERVLKALDQAEGTLRSCVGLGGRDPRYTQALQSEGNMKRTHSQLSRESSAEADTNNSVGRDTAGFPATEPSRPLRPLPDYPSSSSADDSDSSGSGSTWSTDKHQRWNRAHKLSLLTGLYGKEGLFEDDERERKKLHEDMQQQYEAWREEIKELTTTMESQWAEHARSLCVEQPKGESLLDSNPIDPHQSEGGCITSDLQTNYGLNGGGDPSNKPGWEFETALATADDTAGIFNRQLLDRAVAARTRPRGGKVYQGIPPEEVGAQHGSASEQQRPGNSEYWRQDSGYDYDEGGGYDPDIEHGYRGLEARLMEQRRVEASMGKLLKDINRWKSGGKRKK